MKSYFKQKRFRSAKYREFIRSQPPLDKPWLKRSTIHHVKATKFGGNKGMGLTSSDDRGLPLSLDGHREQERIGETAFFKKYNINPKEEIKRLNLKYEVENDLRKRKN